MGNSGFLSSCNRNLGVPIEFQEGSQAASRVESWNFSFLSSCKRGIMSAVVLKRVIQAFLEVQQGSQTSLHVVRGTRASIRVAAEESGHISS